MVINIKANMNAPKKIKDKIKELGSQWTLLRDDQFDGKPAILARANNSEYMRWFLKSDISFEEVK